MNINDLLPCIGYKISEGFIDISKEPQHSAAIDFYSLIHHALMAQLIAP